MIQENFRRFHREHPEVFTYLLHLCEELQTRGFTRYSIKGLWELVRWHFQVEQGQATFKLSNNFHSRYARMLMAEVPQLEGFFSVRELRSER